MHAVFSESHRRHQPTRFLRRSEWADYPEVPERAENPLAAVGTLDRPTVLIQDGGDDCATPGANLTAFLEGFGRG